MIAEQSQQLLEVMPATLPPTPPTNHTASQGLSEAGVLPITMGNDVAMLVMYQGGDSSKRWYLNRSRPMTIGRSDRCDIVLEDRQVSRFHARVSWSGSTYQLEDLGSKNGTHVNGDENRSATPLNDGDEFQIGLRFKLAFVDDGATAPLTMDEGRKGLYLDKDSRTVQIGSIIMEPPLSLPQYLLLNLLWDTKGGVVTRNEIVDAVWPDDSFDGISEQAIDALVRRLRERIAEIDEKTDYVITVRGPRFPPRQLCASFALSTPVRNRFWRVARL